MAVKSVAADSACVGRLFDVDAFGAGVAYIVAQQLIIVGQVRHALAGSIPVAISCTNIQPFTVALVIQTGFGDSAVLYGVIVGKVAQVDALVTNVMDINVIN